MNRRKHWIGLRRDDRGSNILLPVGENTGNTGIRTAISTNEYGSYFANDSTATDSHVKTVAIPGCFGLQLYHYIEHVLPDILSLNDWGWLTSANIADRGTAVIYQNKGHVDHMPEKRAVETAVGRPNWKFVRESWTRPEPQLAANMCSDAVYLASNQPLNDFQGRFHGPGAQSPEGQQNMMST